MIDYSDFEKWLTKNDCLRKNFCLMLEVVTEYLNRVLDSNYLDEEWPVVICRQFPTVLAHCDEITYDEVGVPEAYILLHFMDRYHRYQLTFLDMLKNNTFPIRETINVMDIGTGPGPSLFALSDMIMLINGYLDEKEGKCGFKHINLDYAEQSHGFRDFMHHATEMLMVRNHKTAVPFHHGTYYDASIFQSGERKLIYVDAWKVMNCPDDEDCFRSIPQYVPYKKSFDLVIYSNFLTNIQVVDIFQEQLKKTMLYLKNRGVILIVGGDPGSDKYGPVYERINSIFNSQKYSNKKYAGCYKQVVCAEKMSYAAESEYNKDIIAFFRQMFNRIPAEEWGRLDEKTRGILNKYLEGASDTKWYVSVYKRSSIFRKLMKNNNIHGSIETKEESNNAGEGGGVL